jgi:hypothetical protein
VKVSHIPVLLIVALLTPACGSVSFNMSGASVAPAQTCQVSYFENRAEIVNPRLSNQITQALQDKIQSNTSLSLVTSNADVLFEGEITGYSVQPQAVQASGTAAKDRLTVTVKVKFTNAVKPENSYDKSFSRFYEYTSSSSFPTIEGTAVDAILAELMDDIFNAAFSLW